MERFSRRRPASFTYRDAHDENIRTVDLYGSLNGGFVYLVGRDHGANRLRTFRTDRVVSAKSSPESSRPYAIPSEFDITGLNSSPLTSPHATPSWRNSPFRPAWALTRSNSSPRGETR
ncbi:MAG: WYL domain-containing protein [Collinsella aerofaciens]